MSLVLVVETGAIVAGANSYASAATADDYFAAHVNAAGWTNSATGKKEAALCMATRLIDAYVEFNGRRVSESQVLMWPRYGCPDPDAGTVSDLVPGVSAAAGCFSAVALPRCLVQATCEEALALILVDRTLNPAGEGLKWSQFGDGKTVFDRRDRPHPLSRVTRALLTKLGMVRSEGSAGVVRLTRG